ncbi:MAG: TPM domain-containing protein [Bacteroidota bacterium]|nr:TPM domain-containing protein [Bacteroidota bacterium]MDP3143796.1 TPM domain-containing protein [Bacteroidota bacterium]MDP3556950.1 TPM domain-containing protein [Bacteroidota bacterium]
MPSARNFFNKQEQQAIVNAITQAELKTSGEIRLHLANFCFGNEIKAAEKIFTKLKMQHTNERNGVLIYIATYSKKIAIVGDQGIHQKLGDLFWENLITKLIKQFKENKKAEALADCIIECGEQLGNFFPRKADDKNELTNDISY